MAVFDALRRLWLNSTIAGEVAVGDPMDPVRVQAQPMRRQADRYSWSGSWYSGLQLDTTRVNYAKAQQLYRNTLPAYKLGAGFARPIINITAGFAGIPSMTHEVEEVAMGIEEQFGKWAARLLTLNRNVFRDGDAFVRIDYVPNPFRPEEKRFELRLLVPSWCTPKVNPLTGAWDSFKISYPIRAEDATGHERDFVLVETLTATTRSVKFEGNNVPDNLRQQYEGDFSNEWGFIPIVHFRNEPEDHALYGVSDLESLEPLFKAYHETMLVGHQGIQLFAKPKVKFKVQDVDRFLRDNFPGWRPGQQVSFRGRDIFLMKEGEDASYITAEAGTGGVQTLLELTFYCIVQTSQVPEFVLGTAVASSKASVDTQMMPFVKVIERKRGMVAESYIDLATMFVSMAGKVGVMPTPKTLDIGIGWPEMTARDEQGIATTIKTLVEAFVEGTAGGLISPEAANEFLRDFVPTLLPWLDTDGNLDERRRVIAGRAFLDRLEAGALPEDGNPDASPPGNGNPPTSLADMQKLMRQAQQQGTGTGG